MDKIKNYFITLFQKDSSLKVLSIVSAMMIWMIVSISVYPTINTIVYNVPVEIDLDGTYAQSNQLDVISMSTETVTVEIQGKRAQIGEIKTENLVAKVDASQVMLAKPYKLNLDVESLNGNDFEVLSITPSNVTVTFDKIISKQFEVSAQLDRVKVAGGYLMGDPVVSPSTVTITGPQDKVNAITKVCAAVTSNAELSSTYEFSAAELVMYNNNAVISNDDNMLTPDKTSFAVQVPVYVRQNLKLDVNIINAPDKFNIEKFRESLVFSADELSIAAPNDKIKDITTLTIGTINMREVDIGSETGTVFEFNTSDFLPEGYENLSGTETITVTCPSEGLEKKIIAITGSSIQFVNRPTQFDFEVIVSGMSLYFVGDKEQIESLTRADIIAQIDLIDFDMQEGDYKLPVDIAIPSYDYVWVLGSGVDTPRVYVTATLKNTEEDIS
ncbi:MAG: YbbR-like domain-containing protein [Huintestinicola sp.]